MARTTTLPAQSTHAHTAHYGTAHATPPPAPAAPPMRRGETPSGMTGLTGYVTARERASTVAEHEGERERQRERGGERDPEEAGYAERARGIYAWQEGEEGVWRGEGERGGWTDQVG